jgi:hypothetical protein
MARFVKLHPHLYFKDYDWALWVDANIRLNCKPEELIYDHVNKSNFILYNHPIRDCLYEEGQECIKRNKDDADKITKQLVDYKKFKYPKKAGLYETGVTITRPNNPDVVKLMNIWWREILNGSKRDQISLPVALHEANVDVALLADHGICVRTDPRFIYSKHL